VSLLLRPDSLFGQVWTVRERVYFRHSIKMAKFTADKFMSLWSKWSLRTWSTISPIHGYLSQPIGGVLCAVAFRVKEVTSCDLCRIDSLTMIGPSLTLCTYQLARIMWDIPRISSIQYLTVPATGCQDVIGYSCHLGGADYGDSAACQ
jgi:hypothetical protein